jgi:hypothetical protein
MHLPALELLCPPPVLLCYEGDLLGSPGCQHMYCCMLCSSSVLPVRLSPAVGIAEIGAQDLPAGGLVEKR